MSILKPIDISGRLHYPTSHGNYTICDYAPMCIYKALRALSLSEKVA